MRRNRKRWFGTTIGLILAIVTILPTVLAADVQPRTQYQSAEYNIDRGETEWDGKTLGYYWYVDREETRFNLSITSSSTKTVTATYYKVVAYSPDEVIDSITLSGCNGDWDSTQYYILDHQNAYYAIVTTTSSSGAKGVVSVQ